MKRPAILIFCLLIKVTLRAQNADNNEGINPFLNIENAYNSYQALLNTINENLESGGISEDSAQRAKIHILADFQKQLLDIAFDARADFMEDIGSEESEGTGKDSSSLFGMKPNENLDQLNENAENLLLEFNYNNVSKFKKLRRLFFTSGLTFGYAQDLMIKNLNNRFVTSNWLPETGQVGRVSWDILSIQRRLGRSPFWIRSGINYDYYSIDFGNNAYINPNANGIYLVDEPNRIFRRSNLSMNYLKLPIWLYFNNSRRGRMGFSAAAGIYGGIITMAPMRTLIEVSDDGWSRTNLRSKFYTNPILAGFQFRIGYNQYHITLSQSFTPLFDPHLDIVRPDVYLASLALGWDWN